MDEQTREEHLTKKMSDEKEWQGCSILFKSVNKPASSYLHSDSLRREDSSVTYNQDSQKGSSQRTSHFRGKLLVVTS